MPMIENVRTSNVQRFVGFGALYDQNRPTAPQEVVKLITTYLQHQPQTVVDVGCGTGLSTFIWLNEAEQIIGVEPNDDMRAVAMSKWEAIHKPDNMQFVKRLSHELELPSASADVITCSQSFHWMEPQSTLREFARVLRPGGVFAAYDCDWPPALNWKIEEQYKRLLALGDARALELARPSSRLINGTKKDICSKFATQVYSDMREKLFSITGKRVMPSAMPILLSAREACKRR